MMDEEDRDIDLELDGMVSWTEEEMSFSFHVDSFSFSICYFYDFLSTRIMTI